MAFTFRIAGANHSLRFYLHDHNRRDYIGFFFC